MNCFAHQEISAVGVCVNCGKAACANCIKVSATQVACSKSCLKETVHKKQREKFKYNLTVIRCVRTIFASKLSIIVGAIFLGGNQSGAGCILIALGIFTYIWASLQLEYILEKKDLS